MRLIVWTLALCMAACAAPNEGLEKGSSVSEIRTEKGVEAVSPAVSWNAVVDAASAATQAMAVEAFIASVPKPSNGRPVSFQLGATDAATGATASIADAMTTPSQHEVTVRVEGVSYRFKPLSEASLTPFMLE